MHMTPCLLRIRMMWLPFWRRGPARCFILKENTRCTPYAQIASRHYLDILPRSDTENNGWGELLYAVYIDITDRKTIRIEKDAEIRRRDSLM